MGKMGGGRVLHCCQTGLESRAVDSFGQGGGGGGGGGYCAST